MKRIASCLLVLMSIFLLGAVDVNNVVGFDTDSVETQPCLALVFDDLGECETGFQELLSIDCDITAAVMPYCTNTKKHAQAAHEKGFEVILHMPMEADKHIPKSWYGKYYIRSGMSHAQVLEMMRNCIDNVPHVSGINIHIGSKACADKQLMLGVMESAKSNQLYFLDSYTNAKSVCKEMAQECGVPIGVRTHFLEKTGTPNYQYAKKSLIEAAEYARKHGNAIAIGHIGAEGGIFTAKAVKDSVDTIRSMGVRIVKVSEMLKRN